MTFFSLHDPFSHPLGENGRHPLSKLCRCSAQKTVNWIAQTLKLENRILYSPVFIGHGSQFIIKAL